MHLQARQEGGHPTDAAGNGSDGEINRGVDEVGRSARDGRLLTECSGCARAAVEWEGYGQGWPVHRVEGNRGRFRLDSCELQGRSRRANKSLPEHCWRWRNGNPASVGVKQLTRRKRGPFP